LLVSDKECQPVVCITALKILISRRRVIVFFFFNSLASFSLDDAGASFEAAVADMVLTDAD
jgi:hypothetical protein